jgi:hypothetical protein
MSDQPSPADIELQDNLRSIRGVGENAGRGTGSDGEVAEDAASTDDTEQTDDVAPTDGVDADS